MNVINREGRESNFVQFIHSSSKTYLSAVFALSLIFIIIILVKIIIIIIHKHCTCLVQKNTVSVSVLTSSKGRADICNQRTRGRQISGKESLVRLPQRGLGYLTRFQPHKMSLKVALLIVCLFYVFPDLNIEIQINHCDGDKGYFVAKNCFVGLMVKVQSS